MLAAPRAELRAKAEAQGKGERRCIFLLLTGGPSQLDTFDPKPLAPGEIRGPYRPIATATPGLQLAETLPGLAARSAKFSLIRSLHHDAAPLHETSQQLLQTGRLVRDGIAPPSVGSMVSQLFGGRLGMPAYAVLPRPLGNPGAAIWQGQGGGGLGSEFDPWSVDAPVDDSANGLPAALQGRRLSSPTTPPAAEPFDAQRVAQVCRIDGESEGVRRAYGGTEFGDSCLRARRLVEAGVRFVVVNMYAALGALPTWDCHANSAWAPATVGDYRHTICPTFDRGLSALLDDLEQRGLLDDTLVVASGEFGRAPRLSDRGGREHWTGVWSALAAGGGISGGRVLGASDSRGAIPAERPTTPAELSATILHTLGVDLTVKLPLACGNELAVAEAQPIAELS